MNSVTDKRYDPFFWPMLLTWLVAVMWGSYQMGKASMMSEVTEHMNEFH
jgi:hypothetical protein